MSGWREECGEGRQVIGKRISRKKALRIARHILLRAERERRQLAKRLRAASAQLRLPEGKS